LNIDELFEQLDINSPVTETEKKKRETNKGILKKALKDVTYIINAAGITVTEKEVEAILKQAVKSSYYYLRNNKHKFKSGSGFFSHPFSNTLNDLIQYRYKTSLEQKQTIESGFIFKYSEEVKMLAQILKDTKTNKEQKNTTSLAKRVAAVGAGVGAGTTIFVATIDGVFCSASNISFAVK
jgi:hypothetical protein